MSDEEPVNPVTQHQVIKEDTAPGGEARTKEEQEKQEAFTTFSQDKALEDGVNMSVKIYSPSRVYFDDVAFSVTATNDTGEFDILPKHHPFISLLNACDLIIRTTSEHDRKISISGGLMHVKSDQIVVFLDI